MRRFVPISTVILTAVAVYPVCLAQPTSGIPGRFGRAPTLKIGDQAPPVTITHWVKGRPFDVANEGRGKIVVLEFWATWCMPCLQIIPHSNELNRRYRDKGVVFIALTDSTNGQMLKTVQEFVSLQGSRMDYRVAYDSTRRTNDAYVVASGTLGIPHAVVIGKDGRIVWMGHPVLPDMTTAIEDLILDRYDPAAAARRAALAARIEPLVAAFNVAVQEGDWAKCLSLTDEVLALDPADYDAQRFKILIHLEERHSPADLRAWVEGFVSKHADNVEALTTLSALLADVANVGERPMDLALAAAQAALRADGRNVVAIQTLARMRYLIGDVDGAIRLQKSALGLANILEVDDARSVLKYYELCKSLQGRASVGG